MEDDLAGYLLRVCEILNKHAIEYMIVGGVAMALHGHYRKSIAPDGTQAVSPTSIFGITPRIAIISGCLMHSKHLARTQVNLKTSKRQIQKNPGSMTFCVG